MRGVACCITLALIYVAAAGDDFNIDGGNSSNLQGELKGTYMRTPPEGVSVWSGADALLTCEILGGANGKTVTWKRTKDKALLTAGSVTVTGDSRIHVLHDDDAALQGPNVTKGADVWALLIKNVNPSDSGLYTCEINSNPPIRSFHVLTVVPRQFSLENVNPNNTFSLTDKAWTLNYTDCCLSMKVKKNCLGFCAIKTIIEQKDTGICESDFPAIFNCMADGRNHVPCCEKEQVPDICLDVCRGEYTTVTDSLKTHISCSQYRLRSLACIAVGVEFLPSPPEDVEVETLNDKQLNVSWLPPTGNSPTIYEYVINVTQLRSFNAQADQEIYDSNDNNKTSVINFPPMIFKVPANQSNFVINDLLPLTLYEIKVTSHNTQGSSLPSYAMRSVTMAAGEMRLQKPAASPTLPDVRQCCIDAGVGGFGCVDDLCDYTKTSEISLTDLMFCMPWSGAAFNCLAYKKDHSPCCRAKGLPRACIPMCAGNLTEFDFHHFSCIHYMSEYTNCLLRGFGVLPDSPTNFHIIEVGSDYVVVQWSPPLNWNQSVSYNLNYRSTYAYDYKTIEKVQPPYILENLQSDAEYEVFVEAVTDDFVGDPTNKIVFRTKSQVQVSNDAEGSPNSYNMTACCQRVQLKSECMPLCSYDAKMSDLLTLAPICSQEFKNVLRCGAGGRNHQTCCARRGVPPKCLGVCSAASSSNISMCMPYIGNIIQCFEEGTGILPGPPRHLHALISTKNKLYLEWVPPQEGSNATYYIVHWLNVGNITQPDNSTTMQLENTKNVTDTVTALDSLDQNGTYRIFVVAANEHGTSLPSSIVLLNISEIVNEKDTPGIPVPPHSLEVSSHSPTSLTIVWQLPKFIHAIGNLSFTVYYEQPSPQGERNVSNVSVKQPTFTLNQLTPNTQYAIWVKALVGAYESPASETLLAWTDQAYLAYIEPPVIEPAEVVEGSNVTIQCGAVGIPTPNISLYISGQFVRQEVTQRMVTSILNVKRNMDHVICFAQNGGSAMQVSKKIDITYAPVINMSGSSGTSVIIVASGKTALLDWYIDANPKPTVRFSRDPNGETLIIDGPKYSLIVMKHIMKSSKYLIRLNIKNVTAMDEGDYFCDAKNSVGKTSKVATVRLKPTSAQHNVTECCIKMNVSAACMDICSYHTDMDIIDHFKCADEFEKIMMCGADGSDHRGCCASWGVPKPCIELCRGNSPSSNCFLFPGYWRALSCFRDYGTSLPGPPRNLKAEIGKEPNSIILSWDPPLKNPESVKQYEVFWRADGERKAKAAKANETEVTFVGVLKDARYECVVRSANDVGMSTLSAPLIITTAELKRTAVAQVAPVSSAGSTVGAVFACLIVIAILVAAALYYRHRKHVIMDAIGRVSFRNPTYFREENPDTAAISTNGNTPEESSSRKVTMQDIASNVAGEREVEPSLYEELKLGRDGAGFKRLVP